MDSNNTAKASMGASSQLLLGLICALLLVLAVKRANLYLARRRFKQQHGCRPVQRSFRNRDPILGLDAVWNQIQRSKAGTLLEWLHWRNLTYGPTFAARMGLRFPGWLGGGADAIVTTDPENIKTVLATRFKDYGHGDTRTGSFGPLLGRGIFVVDGARWHESRALLRPNFAREQIADLDALERHLGLFFSLLPRRGDVAFLFGTSVHSLRALRESGGLVVGANGQAATSASDAAFAEAMNDAQADILMRARLSWMYHLRSHPRGAAAIRFAHTYVDRFVEEAVRQREALDLEKGGGGGGSSSASGTTPGGDKYVFLRELAKATKDRRVIRDELLNILLAGRDTTASLLSNLFFVLARRPDVWAKLKADVAVLEGRPPTYETLKKLKYVRYCLNESLRTHPVVPLNNKQALQDTLLPRGGGPDGQSPLFVPKGTVVAWSIYTLHRRREFYGDDADEFRPERWEALRPSWEYLPFNGGPRICVGQQYALTEAAYVTTRLVQEFERIENRDPGPWVESVGLTVCSRNGVKVGLYRASS
ncbi:cytochrome P450 [Apiospora rasikravindrae]|uniref:Cytochrome P450 n=1 Tax=Apiospora rasikravindrae TaxID=990691 RepID=A0ABR1T0A0_9PEZI